MGVQTMASRRSSKRTRSSRSANVRRDRLVDGATALIALGAAAIAGLPGAHADGADVIFEPIINAIDHSLTGMDAVASLDPGASLDIGGLGGGALDQWLTLPAESVVGTSGSGEAATAASSESAATFDELFLQPLHTAEQNWINSPLGESVDNAINKDFGEYLIGNGANGVGGGTLAAANGGAGGLLFGDGGNGATDAAGVGGAGGS